MKLPHLPHLEPLGMAVADPEIKRASELLPHLPHLFLYKRYGE